MHTENKLPFIIFYLLCFEFLLTNSGSTLWKLNSDQTKIINGGEINPTVPLLDARILKEEDFDIISSTVFNGETWLKKSNENKGKIYRLDATDQSDELKLCNETKEREEKQHNKQERQEVKVPNEEKASTKCPLIQAKAAETVPKTSSKNKSREKPSNTEENMFDCGNPINFTHYDSLIGVYNRYILPNVTNPQSASVFGYHGHNELENDETTLMADFSHYVKFLVLRIKKARHQKIGRALLYNFIGNYWQLKGYSLKSIECFRKGLAISPRNARILLNLARLLFSLQYLDDAIYLTKRSLEVEQMPSGVWIHHFTLGEIFKAYGLYQEATVHLNHSLKLKPDLVVAKLILQQINVMHVSDQIQSHTIYIIISLAFLVLGSILFRHHPHIGMPKERHIIRITDSHTTRYFRFRKCHKYKRPLT